MQGKMDCFGLSDRGLVREENEDQFLIADLKKSVRVHQTSLQFEVPANMFGTSQGKIMMVADGLGGHAAGERASQLTVDTILNYLLNNLPWMVSTEDQVDEFHQELRTAVQDCQDQVLQEMTLNPQRQGMGTTLTMGIIIWPSLHLVHVGDSRCYLFRNGTLQQLTTDHTVAQRLIEMGTLRPEQTSANSMLHHSLWNVIGGSSQDLMPDIQQVQLKMGDTLLLCTDGLTKHVPDKDLTRLLRENHSAETTCQRLLAWTKEDGAEDNVSLIVARFRNKREAAAEIVNTASVLLEPEDPLHDPLADTEIHPNSLKAPIPPK